MKLCGLVKAFFTAVIVAGGIAFAKPVPGGATDLVKRQDITGYHINCIGPQRGACTVNCFCDWDGKVAGCARDRNDSLTTNKYQNLACANPNFGGCYCYKRASPANFPPKPKPGPEDPVLELMFAAWAFGDHHRRNVGSPAQANSPINKHEGFKIKDEPFDVSLIQTPAEMPVFTDERAEKHVVKSKRHTEASGYTIHCVGPAKVGCTQKCHCDSKGKVTGCAKPVPGSKDDIPAIVNTGCAYKNWGGCSCIRKKHAVKTKRQFSDEPEKKHVIKAKRQFSDEPEKKHVIKAKRHIDAPGYTIHCIGPAKVECTEKCHCDNNGKIAGCAPVIPISKVQPIDFPKLVNSACGLKNWGGCSCIRHH